MAVYKGVELENGLQKLLPHMPQVEEYRESLQTLQAVWDNLNLLGHLSGTTTEMNNTRTAFSGLTNHLLNSLAKRTLARRIQDLSGKAQVSIDILVRNLFERTADIGFLATDADIRDFALSAVNGTNRSEINLRQRFQAYIDKYSVYFDVVLLSPQGKILERILPLGNIEQCHDRFVQEALNTSAPFVESFCCSTLFALRAQRLIYAYRVNDQRGQAIAVLCLCFDLADEMERIFSALHREDDWSVIALLDEKSAVIASSDPYLIPPGAKLDAPEGDGNILRFAGRSYLASKRQTQGYQGYMGPGWQALALIPLEYAFTPEETSGQIGSNNDPALIASILKSDSIFPPALKSIPVQAEAIQRELERSVWNGNLRQTRSSKTNGNQGFSRILLTEINRTGLRMKQVFAESIGNLQETVISSLLDDCRFLSRLSIDIMDRNLYERANDCRWWALDPVLAELLGKPGHPERESILNKRLEAINDLYTVYDNLVLFDKQRRIVAVSRPHIKEQIGQILETDWSGTALQLNNPAHYTVSGFNNSPLYGGRPSYIYATALRRENSELLGGIGIVFDSEPQFAAMLRDSLPANSENSFGLYVDKSGQIIASSDPRFKAGNHIDLPADLLTAAARSEGESRLMVLGNEVVAVGARQSTGYREYKSAQDSYRNDVIALIFVSLGEYRQDLEQKSRPAQNQETVSSIADDNSEQRFEIATFHVGQHWLGLPVQDVVEAVELTGFTRLPNAPAQVFGSMIYQSAAIPLYNLHNALGLVEASKPEEMQVIVIKNNEGMRFGLLVDHLADIPEVKPSNIEPVSSIFVGATSVLASIVKSADGKGNMLTLLSVASMSKLLRNL